MRRYHAATASKFAPLSQKQLYKNVLYYRQRDPILEAYCYITIGTVKVWGRSGRRPEIGVGVGADDTPEYGDIGGRSVVEGRDRWRVTSAYKGLCPFRAAFAWISERRWRRLKRRERSPSKRDVYGVVRRSGVQAVTRYLSWYPNWGDRTTERGLNTKPEGIFQKTQKETEVLNAEVRNSRLECPCGN